MGTADGTLQIVFNGEIYNYQELKAELEAAGHVFRTSSDTEVLLALYRQHGRNMVSRLRGMFAFAIWDQPAQRLFLARDPFGIKPLYFSDDGKTIRFASQVKALVQGGGVTTTPSPAGRVGFFLLGYVPDPFTFHNEIRALPAGTSAWVDHHGLSPTHAHFDMAAEMAAARQTAYEPAPLPEILKDSLRAHLVSDVPVALFLSSGMDSSSMLGLLSEIRPAGVQAITLGFEEYRGTQMDETEMAAGLAKHYGFPHQSHWISREDFDGELHRALAAMDQPSTDGLNTYFVSRAARQAGFKVALSGLGGDELFMGYAGFRQIPRLHRSVSWARYAPRLSSMIRKVLTPFLKRRISPKYAGVLELGSTLEGAYLLRRGLYLPWELPGLVGTRMAREGMEELGILESMRRECSGLDSNQDRLTLLESTWYMRNQLLRDSDWAGMAQGVEIRVPLVDVDLFRQILPHIASKKPWGKATLASTPAKPIPEEARKRPKTGFATPTREWAQAWLPEDHTQRGLRGWALALAEPERLARTETRITQHSAYALVTDAFGGHGGIAQFNRDFLSAVCAHPAMTRTTALARFMPNPPHNIPHNLFFRTWAINSKLNYLATVLQDAFFEPKNQIVICGHINLVPVARLLGMRWRCPVLLVIHGIDAWTPPRSLLVRHMLSDLTGIVAVSEVTRQRFLSWSGLPPERVHLLPNTVDLGRFSPGPKPTYLLDRYGLHGRKVIMTLGRMASLERQKGFDEILDILPRLVAHYPNLVYLAVGDGDDRSRLEDKANQLGISSHVLFTGLIAEQEKIDHYRLADGYVMPSRGEGFGIVFLEALATGIPVLGSSEDGGKEALRDGMLGILVDPRDPDSIVKGIGDLLQKPTGTVPEGLSYFGNKAFSERVHRLLDEFLTKKEG